ncbi:M56 family metallopeptidase [Pelomonas sp. APW6]|uniref:M56 family metallopeptidase n=1 Tax=Roseateles subflavus TaxID=3053353 RepID=A0ABT7LJM3_9BURK|nr:M56 family metallopeptidase [Pelomonas sp. APW6]MDL5033061.1 M56 family metallopeptidase [Pelomonas sp. APW6]
MTEHAGLQLLMTQTLLFSAAVLLLAVLRPLLRRIVDAGAVYLAWLLVPLLMLSPALPRLLQGQALPAPTRALAQAAPAWLKADEPAAAPAPAMAGPGSRAPAARRPLALDLWMAGAVGLLGLLALRQTRFHARLQRGSRAWIAPEGDSPALCGIWRTRLVLPQDFEQRFDPRERSLILAHEAVHARRHDNAWNLLAAALLALQWFNPLAWWALRRMRQDQELACDAAVLNQQITPDSGEEPLVKTYINALLKSHPTRALPLLSTGWAHQHPLLERVKGLRLHRRPAWQRRLGRAGAAGLCLGLTLLAQAAQPLSTHELTQAMLDHLAREESVSGTKPVGLVVQLDSQQGAQAWQHKDMVFTFAHLLRDSQTQFHLHAPMEDWCLGVHLYKFSDGDLRPQAEILGPHCTQTLTQLQPVALGQGPTHLQVRLPDGAQQGVQAQVSIRVEDPRSERFLLMFRRQLDQMPAEQRQRMLEHIEGSSMNTDALSAQDRAWRLARGVQR